MRHKRTRDRKGRLRFAPATSDRGRQLLEACGEPPDDPSTMLVLDGDHLLTRSDAVIAALRALGGGWRAAGMVSIVPRRLRDALYTAFAKRRYRWFGRAACPVVFNAPDLDPRP